MRNRVLIPIVLIFFSLSSNAHALTISGWSVKIGSVDATFNLEGLPPTNIKPSVGVWNATLKQIEYLCFNPKNKNVAPGVAGQRSVTLAEPVAQDSGAEGRGKGRIDFVYKIEKDTFPCVNRNWWFIPETAAAKEIDMQVEVYTCGGSSSDPKTACFTSDGEPWIQGEKLDILILGCSLSSILRDEYGLPVKGQEYNCDPK